MPRSSSICASPLQARMQNKKVTFPKGAAWVDVFLKELMRFPAGMHDDCVDALAWVIILLLYRSAPSRPAPYRNRKVELSVADKVRRLANGTEGTHMRA